MTSRPTPSGAVAAGGRSPRPARALPPTRRARPSRLVDRSPFPPTIRPVGAAPGDAKAEPGPRSRRASRADDRARPPPAAARRPRRAPPSSTTRSASPSHGRPPLAPRSTEPGPDEAPRPRGRARRGPSPPPRRPGARRTCSRRRRTSSRRRRSTTGSGSSRSRRATSTSTTDAGRPDTRPPGGPIACAGRHPARYPSTTARRVPSSARQDAAVRRGRSGDRPLFAFGPSRRG